MQSLQGAAIQMRPPSPYTTVSPPYAPGFIHKPTVMRPLLPDSRYYIIYIFDYFLFTTSDHF